MPTTIEFPLSVHTTQRLNMTSLDPFNARVDFGILTLWTIILLSIGAAAQFGAPTPEYNDFQLIGLF
jgi:hypothetical protein